MLRLSLSHTQGAEMRIRRDRRATTWRAHRAGVSDDRLVVALQEAEEVRRGQQHDSARARSSARDCLHRDEPGAVVGDHGDEGGLCGRGGGERG
jgi:hypothetical protein